MVLFPPKKIDEILNKKVLYTFPYHILIIKINTHYLFTSQAQQDIECQSIVLSCGIYLSEFRYYIFFIYYVDFNLHYLLRVEAKQTTKKMEKHSGWFHLQ